MRILFVCAGNIVRSVIAESVLKTRSSEVLGYGQTVFTCESCGLSAEAGAPPHPRALGALESIGIPALDTTAAPVDEELMMRADLVLTMTRQQCNVLANRFPGFQDKCFSLIGVNGAVETIFENRGATLSERDAAVSARGLPPAELERSLDIAAATLRSSRRDLLRPLKGVPLDIRDLMTLFPTCYHQVSGIHDPLGGSEEEALSCARQIDQEVSELLYGLLALAFSLNEETGGPVTG